MERQAVYDRDMPREVDEGAIENVYRLQVMNTDERLHCYVIEVNGSPGITIFPVIGRSQCHDQDHSGSCADSGQGG